MKVTFKEKQFREKRYSIWRKFGHPKGLALEWDLNGSHLLTAKYLLYMGLGKIDLGPVFSTDWFVHKSYMYLCPLIEKILIATNCWR